MAEIVGRGRSREHFALMLMGAFSTVALLLAAIGLYGVLAYTVRERTTEIGIRMALGAQGSQVSWLFLRRSFVQLTVGLTLGIAGAFGVGQLFASTQLLVQTSGRDPITIGGIATLLAVVAVAASVLPAKRATRLDPLVALRRD
jgi:ABC-type antimicrobial peptide transport system permease subunit